MNDQALPMVGAAMRIETLPQYADWLMEGQRDLEIQDPCVPEVLDGDWGLLVQEAKSVLDGYMGRMGVHGPFMSLTLLARDPKIRAVVVGRLRRGLEFAGELGATHMVIHSPFDYFGSPFLPHSLGHGQAEQFELIHATLETIVPLAAEFGCTLVIENIYDKHTAPLRALVHSFNSAFVRMSIDIGHAYVKHMDGGPTPDQWVSEARDFLAHLHLQDTDGQMDRHWTPGRGQINWYALFEALGTLSHQPRLILELRNQNEILEGAQWLAERGLAR